MRVLLDECLPRRLRHEFAGHEARTVPEMGWAGKKNGALLRLAVGKFDVLVTVDQHIPHQQNRKELEIAVVAMSAKSNRLADLKPLVPQVLRALEHLKPGEVVRMSNREDR